MINKILVLICAISIVACKCNDIDCVPPPPSLQVIITDETDNNLLANGNLLPEDITLIPIGTANPMISSYLDGILSFSIENNTAAYQLRVKQIPKDTFTIHMVTIDGDCCSSFNILDVKKNHKSLDFRPFLTIKL